jgi:glycine/D-amino acid oxidase-like deaminating enzyme
MPSLAIDAAIGQGTNPSQTAGNGAERTPGIAVIGAGVVGMASALHLQRVLGGVTAIDPLQPGGGASFGNGGLIAVDSCGPMSTPGMLRQAPRWLLNPDGPLAINHGYAIRALPWLMGRVSAGKMHRIIAASDAFRTLHKPALDIYLDMLGRENFRSLIRQSGHVEVWEGADISDSERIGGELRARHGIAHESLSLDALKQLVPQISPAIKRASFVPNGAHTINPLRLVQKLADLFVEAGGSLLREQVMKLLPLDGGGYRVLTNIGDYRFSKLVIAGGAWSNRLLKPLRVSLPLEAERGYHVMVRESSLDLKLPVLHRGKGFGATPMEDGVRFAGTVEIAGLDIEMNERRSASIRQHAENMFPGLATKQSTIWMGFRPCFPDNLPVIDQVKQYPGLFIACGHGHFGVTSAPATGLALSRMMTGQPPAFDLTPFRLARFN